MEMLEEGNYKMPDWSMEARCNAEGWRQKNKPCYSKFRLEDGDIVKRYARETMWYGFICPKCKCFTEIPEEKIPDNIKEYALQVASPGSDAWSKLSDEEKELSKEL